MHLKQGNIRIKACSLSNALKTEESNRILGVIFIIILKGVNHRWVICIETGRKQAHGESKNPQCLQDHGKLKQGNKTC